MKKISKILLVTIFLTLCIGLMSLTAFAATPISCIALDGSSILPVAGEEPKMLTVPSDAPYTVVEQRWLDGKQNPVTVFEARRTYVYELSLQPKSGESFDPSATLTVTGISWEQAISQVITEGEGSDCDCLKFMTLYTVPDTSSMPDTLIGSVTLDGSSMLPVAGEEPKMLTVPADAPYTIAVQTWRESVTGNDFTAFVDGEDYTYTLILQAKSGEDFDAFARLNITGIPWSSSSCYGVFSDSDSNRCLQIQVQYTVREISFEFFNAHGGTDTPTANDNGNLFLWMGVSFAVAAGAVAIIILVKNKKDSEGKEGK